MLGEANNGAPWDRLLRGLCENVVFSLVDIPLVGLGVKVSFGLVKVCVCVCCVSDSALTPKLTTYK